VLELYKGEDMLNKNKESGIYRITNLIDNKYYVGSSSRLRKRKHEHFKDLENNKHCNDYLQNAYNKHGKENFKWEVIEHVAPSEDVKEFKKRLLDREQYHMDEGITKSVLYNIRPTAESRLGSGAEHFKTALGVLHSKEDWEPYYNMYFNEGSTFRSLGKILNVCHKAVKKQFGYFNFKVIENGVYTSKGWLDKKDIDDWKWAHDMYIVEGKSLNYLQTHLKLDKTHIKEIFIGLGLVIKDKVKVIEDMSEYLINRNRI